MTKVETETEETEISHKFSYSVLRAKTWENQFLQFRFPERAKKVTTNIGVYPHWQRDCRRWQDTVNAVNKAGESGREDLRKAAQKVADALTVGGNAAGSDIFLGLLAIDAPLAYAFDYRGFDAWVATQVATTLAPCEDGLWRAG